MSGLNSPFGKSDGDAADFLKRPADELDLSGHDRALPGFVFWGVMAFAWWRMAASMAKASMTSAT